MPALIVYAFRVLAVALGGAMAVICIEKLHEYCQEHYRSARKAFRAMTALSIAMHLVVLGQVSSWHWLYSVGTAMLYMRLADCVHSIELKDVVGNLALTLGNHCWWFKHFLGSGGEGQVVEMEEVTACYVMLVWMVPVMYLAVCSTDATELPTFDGTDASAL